jgi:hypothetical protein
MPVYCYSNKAGKVIEKVFPVGKAPEMLKGGFERDFGAEGASVPSTAGWPMECLGSGVNAEQGRELGEFLSKAGVPTDISKDGNPIYRSASHRREALKARNFVDKGSYY